MGKMTCLFFLCYQFCNLPKSDDCSKHTENVMWQGIFEHECQSGMIRDFNEQAIYYI